MSQENACYVEHRVNIPEEQREKFFSAIGEREAVSIRFRHEDLSGGNDLIAFTEQGSKIITIDRQVKPPPAIERPQQSKIPVPKMGMH